MLRYDFQNRVRSLVEAYESSNSMPRRRALIDRLQRAIRVAMLVLPFVGASAVAEEQRAAKFGELTLSYDAAIWSVSPSSDGFTALCVAALCKGRVVMGRVLPGSVCRANDLVPASHKERVPKTDELNQGELRWVVARWWRGCRNAHPPSIAACAVGGGSTYRIEAAVVTCRTGPLPAAEDAILALIRGISRRVP